MATVILHRGTLEKDSESFPSRNTNVLSGHAIIPGLLIQTNRLVQFLGKIESFQRRLFRKTKRSSRIFLFLRYIRGLLFKTNKFNQSQKRIKSSREDHTGQGRSFLDDSLPGQLFKTKPPRSMFRKIESFREDPNGKRTSFEDVPPGSSSTSIESPSTPFLSPRPPRSSPRVIITITDVQYG